jgi:hypothetical protein
MLKFSLCSFVMSLLCCAAAAQTSPLDQLVATLTPLREHVNDRLSNDHGDTRGATPVLTIAKHQLRDWIETVLKQFPENGDTAALGADLHAGLRDAHLFCDTCFPSFLGYVDEVQIDREREFLIVRTSTGIWCGYDDSAYVYQWVNQGWRRIFDEEQTVYTAQKYLPRILYAVHISSPGSDRRRLIMTLGSRPGCSVAFQPVYYNVWQTGPKPRALLPRILVQGTEFAYIGEFPPIKGRVGPDDALIEFTAGGTGYGQGHQAVRHFQLRGGKMEQSDPIAPNPRDFVEEWLAAKWERSAAWSELPSLKTWHAKLHRDDGMGDFPEPTQHCKTHPDLWQVGIKLHDVPEETWYVVRSNLARSKGPEHFTMAAISHQPDPDCIEKAPATAWPRTLFPGEN